jgi:tight adherence protein B
VSAVVALGLLACIWGLWPSDGQPGRLRLLLAQEPRGRSRNSRFRAAIPLVGLLLLVAGLTGGSAWVIFPICLIVLSATGIWLWNQVKRHKTMLLNRDQVLRSCVMLSGRLMVGELPAAALRAVAEDAPLLSSAASAVQVGARVAERLREVSTQPGCAGFQQLADGWQLAEQTGMPLAAIVGQITDSITAQNDLAEAREAELSSARATGRLLAGLPMVGLLMGFAVDADPLAFLGSTLIGQLCVLGSCALACTGLIWTERMAQTQEER